MDKAYELRIMAPDSEGRTVMRWFRRLFHKHFWYWNRNIHGDEIMALNGMRSEWHCVCGAVQFRDYLVGGR